MSTAYGKGTVGGSNSPSGGYVVGRKLISSQAASFSLTQVGWRATSQNTSHTAKYRVAVYDGLGNLLGNSNEVGFSDGITCTTATEFAVSLITPVTITNGETYFVFLIQNPTSDLTLQLDTGGGTDEVTGHGFFVSGNGPGNTVPPNPYNGNGDINTQWMVWAIGVPLTTDYSLTALVGAFILTGQSVTKAYAKAVGRGIFSLTGIDIGVGNTLTATVGAFILTGQNVVRHSLRTSLAGAFAVTGVNIIFNRVLSRSLGTFTSLRRVLSLRNTREAPPKLRK